MQCALQDCIARTHCSTPDDQDECIPTSRAGNCGSGQAARGETTNGRSTCGLVGAFLSYCLRRQAICVRMAATRSLRGPFGFFFCKYPHRKRCHRFGDQDHQNPSIFGQIRVRCDGWSQSDRLSAKLDSGQPPNPRNRPLTPQKLKSSWPPLAQRPHLGGTAFASLRHSGGQKVNLRE